jgi:hypothetical protein
VIFPGEAGVHSLGPETPASPLSHFLAASIFAAFLTAAFTAAGLFSALLTALLTALFIAAFLTFTLVALALSRHFFPPGSI